MNTAIRVEQANGTLSVTGTGDWIVTNAADLFPSATIAGASECSAANFDFTAAQAFDTTGALIIVRMMNAAEQAGMAVTLSTRTAAQKQLIETVKARFGEKPVPPETFTGFKRVLENIGKWMVDIGGRSAALIGFVGLVMQRLLLTIIHPARFRIVSMVRHMEEAGINAIPIVALISFLVGVVFAYQGAFQLRQFGAEIFVVDLLTLSILREVGVLLTAILVAGRSGSAFTAEIGAMKVREEVDAMKTIGLHVIDVLVLPRFIALALMLPLLTFAADMAGMLGGMLMSWVELGISPGAFIARFAEIGDPWHFFTGMIKAPFFAFIIALVGCFEGLQVEGSAESVGRLTTQAVVEAVFLVIVVDGIFSVFFALIGV